MGASAVTITPDATPGPPVTITPDAATPAAKTTNQTLGDQIYDLVGNAAKSLAKVSGPNIMYELLRQNFPKANLPPALGKPNENEIMQAGLMSMIPEAEAGAPETAAEGAAKTAPTPKASSVLEHPGVAPWVKAAKAEVMKIPGMNLAKTALESARGFAEGTPEAPAPPTPAPPPSEFTQLKNSNDFGTPQELRGTRIAPPKPSASAVSTPAAAEPATSSPPAAAAAKTTPAAVEQQLSDALGGKKLVPGVSLRNQPSAQAVAAGKLPEGFTPVDSSVLKGYKYDPDAQEFTAITKNGQIYTHGEVTPDQVGAFESAASKGRAWTSAIRNSSPLVRKNGIPVKPVARSASEDLTDIMQRSLDAVRAQNPSAPVDVLGQVEGANPKLVGSQATGKAGIGSDTDVKVDMPSTDFAESGVAALEAKGYQHIGSSLVSPKEAAASGKVYSEGWSRVHHFKSPGGQRLDIWTDANAEPVQNPSAPAAEKYLPIGKQVSGLDVGDNVPNTDSISATLNSGYKVLPGIREVPLSDFNSSPRDLFYAADDMARTRNLADQIKQSGRIDPLIVVRDADGPYVLEGGHRLGALNILGKKSFPAMVIDDEAIANAQTP